MKVILNFEYYTSYRYDAAGLDTVAAASIQSNIGRPIELNPRTSMLLYVLLI